MCPVLCDVHVYISSFFFYICAKHIVFALTCEMACWRVTSMHCSLRCNKKDCIAAADPAGGTDDRGGGKRERERERQKESKTKHG